MSSIATPRIDEPLPDDADADDPDKIEHARRHWARLVSRFVDMGEPMHEAMVAAARIVAFASTGPLAVDGNQETRRNSPPPASGIRRRIR